MKVVFLNDVNSIKYAKSVDAMEFCLHPEGTNPYQSTIPFEECEIEIEFNTNTSVKKIRGYKQLERQLDIAESKIPFLSELSIKKGQIVQNTFANILDHHPCPEHCFTPL